MKKLVIIVGIVLFCLPSVLAQYENETQKNENKLSLIIKDEMPEIVLEPKISLELLEKYGEEKITQACKTGKVEVSKTVLWEYNKFGTKQKITKKTVFLIVKNNELIESDPVYDPGSWTWSRVTVVVWVLLFVFGLFLFKIKKIFKSFIDKLGLGFIVILILAWLVDIAIIGQWIPLIFGLLLIIIGLLINYIWRRTKKSE